MVSDCESSDRYMRGERADALTAHHALEPGQITPRRIRGRAAYTTTGIASQGLARLVVNLVIGLKAGPATLGLASSAIATAQIFALFYPTTAGAAAIKYTAQRSSDRGTQQNIAAHIARRGTVATILLAGLSAPVWYGINGSADNLWVVPVLTIAYSGYSISRGIQLGRGHVRRSAAWEIAAASVSVVGVCAAVAAGIRDARVVLPVAVGYLAYTAANMTWQRPGKVPRALRREIDGFIALGVLATVTSAGFLNISVIMARLLGGVDGAGQYVAALTLVMPASLVSLSLSAVLMPTMAAAYASGGPLKLRPLTDRAVRVVATVSVPVFLALIVASPVLVDAIWGAGYSEAGKVAPILLVSSLISTTAVPAVTSLTCQSQRSVAASTIGTVLGAFVGSAAWAVLLPSSGLEGIAVGYLVGTAVTSIIPVLLVWRSDRHAWFGLWGPAYALIVAMAAAAVAGLFDPPVPLGLYASCGLVITLWALLLGPRLCRGGTPTTDQPDVASRKDISQ